MFGFFFWYADNIKFIVDLITRRMGEQNKIRGG